MSSKVTEALSELAKLPVSEQERAAEAILDFAHRDGRPMLTDEQAEEVRKRLADPQPAFLTLAEAKAQIARLGA
jgi:hypothetical protein